MQKGDEESEASGAENFYINSQIVHTAERVKVINDPIHGHFELPGHVLDVIDTPHVQRLRDLKQLGGTYLVYPGASHNRFEHSLGVSHLSRELVRGLYTNVRDPMAKACYENERHFQDSTRIVELAGLVHDLGHGPFSHMWDHGFLPQVMRHGSLQNSPLIQHEARSVMLFEHLIETYNIDLDRCQVRHIGDLITGVVPTGARNDGALAPRFLYNVVANVKTGIDTDKFDYLARDVYNVGLQGAYGFDHRRLMKFAKVIGDDLCFHRKEIFNVYHLFLTRFQLHRTVYNHRAALSIDAMITDALIEADHVLHISDTITDPVEFLRMTDTIIPIIEYSKDPALNGAKAIIHRLRRRQLYRFVDEVLLPAGVSSDISAPDITTHQDSAGTGVNLRPSDIHVAHVTHNFGMKEQNPVDNVLFFANWEDQNPTHIPSSNVSYVMPVHFQEKIIRVFVRPQKNAEGDRIMHAVKVAFRRFARHMNLGSPLASPVPRRSSVERRAIGRDISLNVDGEEEGPGKSENVSVPDKSIAAMSASARIHKRKRPAISVSPHEPASS